MYVLLITRLLQRVGWWACKPVNHKSWMAVVTPTDRPRLVRNRCLIELFCGIVCVVTLPFWHFCWCRGFCHRTESDLLLFVCQISPSNLLVYTHHCHMILPGQKCRLLLNSVSTESLYYCLPTRNMICIHFGLVLSYEKYICAIWRHGWSTNSGDFYGHKLCST